MADKHLVEFANSSKTTELLIDYWRKNLLDAPPLLCLPTDRPRQALRTFTASSLPLIVSQDLTTAITAFSQQEKARIVAILLTCFNMLLSRYTSSNDILVGLSISTNNLVIRTQINGNPSFRELLGQVEKTTISAYAHQGLSWEKLLEVIRPEKDLSYSPIFQVMLAFKGENSPENIEVSELTHNSGIRANSTTKLDLTLSIEQTSKGIIGKWEYSTDLFDQSTIERMNLNFQTLLADIIAHPTKPITNLNLLNANEKNKLLIEWNNTQTNCSYGANNKCIHQLFEEQAERNPNAVALVSAKEQLTYRDFNHRANQLARYLQKLGVGAEVLVGLSVERSLNSIIGILAILKAGAAYVPLDPNYPQERLSHILSDAKLAVVLTQQQHLAKLPLQGAVVVCMDSEWNIIAQESGENLVNTINSENLAYVIYTSGSTGKPKGVEILHRSVLNLSQALQQAIYDHLPNRQLRVSLNGTLSFDTSVKQWIQLLHGHTLDIVPEIIRIDGNGLLSYLQTHKIDVFDCTPSQLILLVEAGILSLKDNVPECILVGGEAIDLSTWQALAQSDHINFYNVYGPTECTVDTTLCNLKISPLRPIIGRPISNTQVYILDRYLQLTPIGVPGELHIGGAGLARSYLNRPDLTQAKFIPDPFSDQPNTRLYKTGDLARYLPDGNIEYVGRIDNQVKIRGFRIELGEIESLLSQHPNLSQAVVIVYEKTPGDKRLVAYIVSQNKQVTTTNKLRKFLSQNLPSHMIPSVFVIMENLPLTPNGKVDRRALPAPDSLEQAPEENFVAPLNDLELQLTQIWQRVLGMQCIGVKDNFFELGGHSLLAVRLLSEIQNELGKNLPLATFFTAQTIQQLAIVLAQEEPSVSWSCLVPIQIDDQAKKPPLFCIHAVWGNVLFYRKLVRHLPENQPVYGLQAKGLDGREKPTTSVTEMAANYIQAIRSVQPQGPYYIIGYSFGGVVAFEVARQLYIQGQEMAMLGILDTPAPSGYELSNIKNNSNILSRFFNRSTHHLRNLLKLNFGEQINYIAGKIQWHLTVGRFSFLYRKYLLYIKRSPLDLRLADLNLANSKANRKYSASVFPGKLTLFRCNSQELKLTNSSDLSWSKLALGGVEIHQIIGKHTTIMEEPDVRDLAEKLNYCLVKAQEKSQSIINSKLQN